VQRCESVVIEHCDALELVGRYDGPETVFYVDPPYLKGLRTGRRHLYPHDLEDGDHVSLAAVLRQLGGTVLLSGYRSRLYEELYADWHREERWSVVQGGGRRREVLWMNRRRPAPRLFAGETA
jgi:DNA adenine methylase